MSTPGVAAIAADVWRGRTILRSLEDAALSALVVLEGLTVDLGGGGSGYLSRLRTTATCRCFEVDVRQESTPDVVANLEQPLPFATASVDTLLLNNVLEHILDYQQLVDEIHRVLRPGGRLYFAVPFLVPVHELLTDHGYRDYHRFSGIALGRVFAAFSRLELQSLQVGPYVAGCHVASTGVPSRLARAAMVVVASVLDGAYERLRRRRDRATHIAHVLGYVGVATR